MVDMELVLENESGVELLLLLLQTSGFRKRYFTCKPGSIHVLSCGIAKTSAIMRRRMLYLVSDCQAIHSAECYTDDKLVSLTYNLPLPLVKRQPRCRTTLLRRG